MSAVVWRWLCLGCLRVGTRSRPSSCLCFQTVIGPLLVCPAPRRSQHTAAAAAASGVPSAVRPSVSFNKTKAFAGRRRWVPGSQIERAAPVARARLADRPPGALSSAAMSRAWRLRAEPGRAVAMDIG